MATSHNAATFYQLRLKRAQHEVSATSLPLPTQLVVCGRRKNEAVIGHRTSPNELHAHPLEPAHRQLRVARKRMRQERIRCARRHLHDDLGELILIGQNIMKRHMENATRDPRVAYVALFVLLL